MEKKEARRQAREAIARLTPEERAAKSQAIRRRLQRLPELKAARRVMGFLPLPDELDTRPILADLVADDLSFRAG